MEYKRETKIYIPTNTKNTIPLNILYAGFMLMLFSLKVFTESHLFECAVMTNY